MCVAEGDQNMPPQNMPFWYKDYFEVKTTENERDRGYRMCSLPSLDLPQSNACIPLEKVFSTYPYQEEEKNPHHNSIEMSLHK